MKKALQILGIIALVFVITAAVVTIIHFSKSDENIVDPITTSTQKNKMPKPENTLDPYSIYIAPYTKDYCVKNCAKITAKELKRNPGNYKNKLISIEGKVDISVFSMAPEYKYYYSLIDTNNVENTIIYNYDSLKSSVPYKGDKVIFYGEFLYVNALEQPVIRAYYIDFID